MRNAAIVEVKADRPYQVRVSQGASLRLGEVLPDGARRVAILHPAVLTDLAARLARTLDTTTTLIQVPDGEAAKTPATLAACWERVAEAGLTRSDVVVGIGGGSTTDLAGLVAATWLRGVGFVSVPTTVLGMVDAAVGGKTGINLPAGKNLVGSFYEPLGVLCDLELLEGLPAAEVASGLAEVIKCGLIADPRITELIDSDPEDSADVTSLRLAELVRRAIAVKAAVVSTDLREATSVGGEVGREILNYGHTLGHAVEGFSGYALRHGEAISIGMVYVAELARRLDLLDDAGVQLHRDQLSAVGLPTAYADATFADLRPIMALDKKTRGDSLRFVLLNGLQHAVIAEAPDEAVLAASYAALAP